MIKEGTLPWEETFEKIWWAGNMPWSIDGGILSPILMPHAQKDADRNEVKKILKESGAIVALWTTNWNCNPTKWYWTCCDLKEYELEKIENSRGRRNIKNGLKNCEIKQVDPNLFAQEAYPIYVESLVSYGYLKSEIPEPSKFNKEIILKSQYAGTRYWAAYAEGTMIAYSTCFEVDGGVSLGSTKSLKAFQKLNANSALFYEICKYYLGEGQALYVSNGRTNLLHPTKINDFLELIGFRKIYGKLNLELSTIAKIVHVTRIGTWGKYILLPKIKPKLWGKIEGFSKLMEIEKSF